MQRPARQLALHSFIQIKLAADPAAKPALAAPENEVARRTVAICEPRTRAQNGCRGRTQHDLVFAVVLRALGRQRNQPPIEVDFAPAQRTDLFAAPSGQDQQPDNIAVSVIPHSSPDRAQLVWLYQ